jgi:uncharacterized protein YyaL (SSP411 family)
MASPNRLLREKSPYLLQHAYNPVDWYPWGEEAFAKARAEDKPIFLSIGYSTCHWCHVMERESFESEATAEILNRHYVPVKVDREERPDVDRIYMTYVQATTGGGGWPMSVWLTPELKPFLGGTYFPPDNRYGRPGFPAVLEYVAEKWKSDRAQIVASSREVIEEILRQTAIAPAAHIAGKEALDSCFYALRRSFDARLGGFGGAPKFPRPVALNFLLRYWARTRNEEALEMVLKTLDAMARGGMHDQLGGGFHRYAVDARWFVPHFEKMLYDQAQLAISYLEAYQISGQERYAAVARGIFEYVLREMTDPAGGFYSAEDADSVIDPAEPHKKGEGAFYVWSQEEIDALLGQPAAKYLSYHYGVEAGGNVYEDPHQEFTGRNILAVTRSAEETARHFEAPVETVRAAIEEGRRRLLEARGRRVRPHLDDKILTAWNGLMISAFAKGGAILGEPRYLDAARRAADFLAREMYRPAEGILLRRYRGGEAAIPGFADDYAFFAQALLDLYEAAFDLRDLDLATELTRRQCELFEDSEGGGFYSTAAGDPSLVMRMKEDYDGAEPSANSVTALNLVRLAEFTGEEAFRSSAERLFRAFSPRLTTAGVTVPQMLAALDWFLHKPKQIVLAGAAGSAELAALAAEVHRRYLPGRVILMLDTEESRRALAARLPALAGMAANPGPAVAYVCEDFACRLPVSEPAAFRELLN